MKVPTIFLPERNIEDSLERILRKEKKRASVTRLSGLSSRYDYYCDVCGNLAGSIEVLIGDSSMAASVTNPSSSLVWGFYPTDPGSDSHCGSLVINSFTGNTTLTKEEGFLLSIGKYLEKGDLKSVWTHISEYASFYCLECDKFYCDRHWDTQIVTGIDRAHDYKLRVCPEGHEWLIVG